MLCFKPVVDLRKGGGKREGLIGVTTSKKQELCSQVGIPVTRFIDEGDEVQKS